MPAPRSAPEPVNARGTILADSETYDLLVVGGGINGAGIARDAAGRGLRVALCERDDLAGATSSASSKLIHGGLRYLEYYQFRLVRKALAEREVLLRIAPHLVRPLRFVLPHVNTIRPAWLVRLGLFFYDHLGPHPSLPNSKGVDLRRDPAGRPVRDGIRKGFSYYDCWVDDARLVILNAVDAARLGAHVMTRTKLLSAERTAGVWQARLARPGGGEARVIRARALVNAAGPWVEQVLATLPGDGAGRARARPRMILVKGSHIVVPRLHDENCAYILQHTDRRVIFVLPFEGAYSLIGTTDVPFDGEPADARITAAEIRYLCDAVNAYFVRPVEPADVRWSFAGVRPLFGDGADDPAAVSRDYILDLDGGSDGSGGGRGAAPLLSVFGGKITTYRRLAEQAMAELEPFFPDLPGDWTAAAPLPGGDLGAGGPDGLLAGLIRDYPALPADLLAALARRHGGLARDILASAKTMADLGPDFGASLTGREVDHMVAREWAAAADDILWRRSKCGLHMNAAQKQAVAAYLAERRGGDLPAAV